MKMRTQMVRNETFTPKNTFKTLSERVGGAEKAAKSVKGRVELAADLVTQVGKTDGYGQTTARGTFSANAGALTRMVRKSAFNLLEGVAGCWHPALGRGGAISYEGSVGKNESGERRADIRMTRSRTIPEDYYESAETLVQQKSLSILEEDGKLVHTIDDGSKIERVIDNGNGTLTYQVERRVRDQK